MNSPSHLRNQGFSINPEGSKFVIKPNSPQIVIPKTSIMNHSMISHHSSYGTIPRNHTMNLNEVHQTKIKFTDIPIKTSISNTPNRSIEHKGISFQPRTSDISACSIKETVQISSNQDMSGKLNAINNKLNLIFQKFTTYDEKLKELKENIDSKQKMKGNTLQDLYLKKNIEQKIKRTVELQIQQSQQHFIIQSKIFKADLDTIKLEMMCLADKKQVQAKISLNQKNINDLKRQIEQKHKQQLKIISENRKKDIERFEKEVQQIKLKLMEIQFTQQSISLGKRICLIKNLSLKVLQQLQVYSQKQLKWIEIGKESILYGIDQEGYLLDHQNKYITNEKGQLIKIQETQIQILKQHGLIQ